MLAEAEPAWLLAWRERDRQPVPVKLPPAPRPPMATAHTETFRKGELLGIVEPDAWEYDGGARREPVVDNSDQPPRVVRRVGWQHCLKCRKPFFSEDVVRLRLCSNGGQGCREDEDRFA